MGMDTDGDVAIEACTLEERRQIQDVRDRFLAEHLGVEIAEVSAAMNSGMGILKSIEKHVRYRLGHMVVGYDFVHGISR